MTNLLEIVLRDCGRAGWLGLVYRGKVELYRTGSHWPTASGAFARTSDWMDQNEDFFHAA